MKIFAKCTGTYSEGIGEVTARSMRRIVQRRAKWRRLLVLDVSDVSRMDSSDATGKGRRNATTNSNRRIHGLRSAASDPG